MKSARATLSVILFFFALLLMLNEPSYSNDVLLEEFRRDAPQAWLNYLESLRNIEFTKKLSERYIENGGPDTNSSITQKTVNYPYQIGRYDGVVAGEHSSEIFAHNPLYRFALEPDKDNPGKWSIIRCNKMEPPSKAQLQFPAIENYSVRRPLAKLPFENQVLLGLAESLKIHFLFWFPSLAADDEFEIVQMTEEYDGDLRMAHIVYRYEPEDVAGTVGPAALRSGQVWLLPDNSWVVKKAIFDVLDAGDRTRKIRFEHTLEYDLPVARYPLPTKVVTTCDYGTSNPPDEGIYEYEWKRDPPRRPKKEYYLSYYGLPEPEFESSFKWVRPALVLLGLLFISMAYRVMRNRKNAALPFEQ